MKNLKNAILAFLITATIGCARAQNFRWATTVGGPSNDYSVAISTDNTGNIFHTGVFFDSLYVNAINPNQRLRSNGGQDIFILKTDTAGNYLWSGKIGGAGNDSVAYMCSDANGNIYLSGFFEGTVDFDPGVNIQLMTATNGTNNTDCFILKLNSSGQYLWSISFGGPGHDEGQRINLDATGDILATGLFSDSADFDPSSNLLQLNSNGYFDIFISKYSGATGSLLWAKSIGGPGEDVGTAISADPSGNIVVTGWYSQTVDFNPDPLYTTGYTSNNGSIDAFVLKLNNSGNFIWVRVTSGPDVESSNSIAVDGIGSIYITGGFQSDVNFDPTSSLIFTNQGFYDGFILKYNSSGQVLWARQIGGQASDAGYDIAIDDSNNVYTTGCFTNTVNFNTPRTSVGGADVYIAKYYSNGTCSWSGQISGIQYDIGRSICLGNNSVIYLSGNFGAPQADLDPTNDTSNVSSYGGSDAYLVKLIPQLPCSTSVTVSTNPSGGVCPGTSVTFTAASVNGGSSPTYSWYNNGQLVTGNSTSTYTSIINGSSAIYCTMTSSLSCASPAVVTSTTDTVNTTNIADSVSISATATNVCPGTAVTFAAAPFNGGGNPSYVWYVNGQLQSGNSPFFTITVNTNQIVYCSMYSSLACAAPNPVQSNSVALIVTTVQPTITLSASNTAVCAGTVVTFTANCTNAGNTPTYQWMVNGITQSTSSNSVFSTPIDSSSTITCTLTSSLSCAAPNITTSNPLTVTANTVLPSVSITTNDTAVCPGTNVTLTAIPSNGGSTPGYQWYVNGAPQAGSNNATFTTLVNTGTTIACAMTSSLGCAAPNPVNSNSIQIVISNNVIPAVSIASNSGNAVCLGATVTFTATPSNGGNNPQYIWTINGAVATGANSSTLTEIITNFPTVVYCSMQSDASCASSAPVYSNSMTLVQSGSAAVPTVTLAQCILTSTSANTYQWILNGNPIPNAIAQLHQPTINGFYQVEITESGGCSATSSITLVNCVVGIEEIDPALADVVVFPNPASDILHLTLPIELNLKVELFSVEGKNIYIDVHDRFVIRNKNSELSTRSIPSGMYILKLTSIDGVKQFRLAIMH